MSSSSVPSESRPRLFFGLLFGCLRPQRGLFGLTVLTVLAFNVLELSVPKLLQLYVDSISGSSLTLWGQDLSYLATSWGQLVILPLLLLLVALLRWVATYARTVLQTRLSQGALFRLRSRIFNTMQQLSFAYHDRSHSGMIISNIVEDVMYARHFFQMGLFSLLEAWLYIVVALAVMFSVCPAAGLTSLGLLLIAPVGSVFYYRCGYRIYARTKELFADMVQLFSENMEGHLVVRAFGCEREQTEQYHRHCERVHRAMYKELVLGTLNNQSYVWAAVLGIPAVLFVAVAVAQNGQWDISGGRLFLLFFIQRSIVQRVRMSGHGLDLAMRFTVTAERLGNLFGERLFLEQTGERRIPDRGPGRLDTENVSFAYGNRSKSLKDISLTIAAGQTVGLVGPTGAGKTTLALLLCRFHDPDEGRILLDHKDIREYRLEDVRNQFSLVFQDSFLFSTTIWQNIAYGRPDADYEEIVHAAKVAHAHDFIMQMSEGYDTVVGERGVTLSGGQRQRISIARAVLRRPSFLILDACTSAVDALTERAIQDSLNELRDTSTVIVIAQRYSSVADADYVYVLDDGRVIEEGTPDKLNVSGTAFSRTLHITEPLDPQ